MGQITREQIITAAREAAEQQGIRVLSRTDFERLTGISQYHIYKLFPEGGWSEVVQLAELDDHPQHHTPIDDEELLKEFHRVTTLLGRIPTWPIFDQRATISADVVRRRFGGREGTLRRYQAWLAANNLTSPVVPLLHPKSQPEISQQLDITDVSPRLAQWTKTEGIQYGAPINFRGLRHAPINEQGVVYLFGMVSYEIGFLVEAIHTSYPDCEAKRCVDQRADRWQQMSIEFEYRSSNFRAHGHDPSKCDVIVCWEHDWVECPLEVVELRRVIDDLGE